MNPTPPQLPAFHGVYAALVTPMSGAEEVDYTTLATFTDHLIRSGVHGLVPLGSTGEFQTLSPAERERILATVLEVTAQRVPVIAGANGGSTRDVLGYCRQAEELGADGVMLAAPYYCQPQPDELYAHFLTINDALGIPIMLYNTPGRTGVDMTPEWIERLAGLKNVRYVKESTGDLGRVTRLQRLCGDRFAVFCGCDTLALESFLHGAVGWVGGGVNVVPQAHVQLHDLAVVQGNLTAAMDLYRRLLPILELLEGGGKYTQLVKAGCELQGHPVGPPRGPLQPATNDERIRLRDALRLVAAATGS